MKNKNTPLLSIAVLLALSLGVASAHAQPPQGKGPHGNPGKQAQQQGKPAKHKAGHDSHRGDQQRQDYAGKITIEEAVIRSIFRDEQRYIQPASSLPPGIQKNLARGKPLPPGIAKQFDSRIDSRLPRYPGYDWRQVGRDAILIEATTGIIEAIITDVLQY